MKGLYEIGFVFRGFVIVSHEFRKIPKKSSNYSEGPEKDLRGAFISAISAFAETAFNNSSLEYLESGEILFIFKMDKVRSLDGFSDEPIILYSLVKRLKKKPDRLVRKILENIEHLLQLFIQKYNGKDFCELNQFKEFEKDIIGYFNIEEIDVAS